ncbi:hypothetical protein CcrColossus_gp068 [Caulobacter phage CcrColossus]|uniref:Uncharacterized protein n=1 Tax=Caulobacter phage CcrColossus TaxID=1211640 RepID=K4JVR1_9CAUD|nr:hypothetical protein CcrColossus_gp068 [Caulobacter phage CcrColossus]AFU87938.1 hypothetical protein CcrColossus_gp068 [Caulobacter phage CcrColossus]
MPDLEEHLRILKRAFKDFHERNTVCRADGCDGGYVVLDQEDIDWFTQEPRASHCPKCKGTGFVPRQMELPL